MPAHCDLRVALVHHLSMPRGSFTLCMNLVQGLTARGNQAQFFTLREPGELTNNWNDQKPGRGDSQIVAVGEARRSGRYEEQVLENARTFAHGLVEKLPGNFDVVHIHDFVDYLAIRNIKSSLRGSTVVRTVHHVGGYDEDWLHGVQDRSILEAERIITVSRYWQRELQRRYGRASSQIYNGVDLDRFASRHPTAYSNVRHTHSYKFLFLTVGGMAPRKGTLELFRALAMIKRTQRAVPVQLVVVGGHSPNPYAEYRSKIREEIESLGLREGDDFVLLGTVPDTTLTQLYQAVDAFVFPSTLEGWGLSALEAMAAGLPTILTDIPVFREFATQRDTLFVPPRDPKQLARTMIQITEDHSLRTELQARGRLVAARYPWERCVGEHVAAYRRAVV